MDKVIDIEERIPTLRKKRKRRTNFKFIILILLFFFTLFLLLYFQSPYSTINKIEVIGSELVEKDLYVEKSGLQQGNSMWGFSVGEIEEKILKQHWVKDVEVKRKWLTTVKIEVEEWEKVAYILEDNQFYPMLENGDLFDEVGTLEPVDAPLFLEFDDEKLRKKLLKELAELDSTVLAQISQINASPSSSDPYGITLYMNDGYEVRAEITSLAEKLNYYPSIVAQIESNGEYEKGIIDIEVGSYYRSFSDEYMQLVNLEELDAQQEEQEVILDEGATSQ